MPRLVVTLVLIVGCGLGPTDMKSDRDAKQLKTDTVPQTNSQESSANIKVEEKSENNIKESQSNGNVVDGVIRDEPLLEFSSHPKVIPERYPRTPLVRTVQFSLKGNGSSIAPEGQCHITIKGSAESWRLVNRLKDLQLGAREDRLFQYELDLYGLKADTHYDIDLEVNTSSLTQPLQASTTLRTKPVSPLFPQFELRAAVPEKMEPGLTLFNLIRWENDLPDSDFGAIVAIDEAEEIRWSYQAPHLIFIVRQLSNGNLLYGYGNRTDGLIEIDLRGNVVRQWDAANLERQVAEHAIPVEVDSFHHDVIPVAEDRFIALSTSLEFVSNYYSPDYSPRSRIPRANLVTDEVIEFHESGQVMRRFRLFDLLDPYRIGYGSLHDFWDKRGYEQIPGGTFDWSHSNSVSIDPDDGNIIVSVRHQECVIKIDRQSGELLWILGTPKSWKGAWRKKLLKPVGGVKWPYHQHAASMTPHGTLLLFDNGNFQAVPFDKQRHASENFSRVVEYRVDEEEMTVEQVWEYAAERENRFYSTFLCDVDWLPDTRNVLITNGGEIRDENGKRTDFAPGDRQWAEIFEVTYGDNPRRVFDMVIQSPTEQPEIGWSVYRAERIKDFFNSVAPTRSVGK